MRLTGEKLPFRPSGRKSNPIRVLIYIGLIAGGILLTRMVEVGRVKPLLSPTPVPTRTANSFAEQGKAFFSAGDMDAAILAYESAVLEEPNNGLLWAELARIQTYSSELETNYELRSNRLDGAITSIDRAIIVQPDEPIINAIQAFVYDWAASAIDERSEKEKLLNDAELAIVRANELSPEHPIILAYHAEILTDQQKWAQALDKIELAVARIDQVEATLGEMRMDVYRVYGTVLENLGLYRRAIEEYERAASITPNLTFLYLRIGVNYRELLDYDKALEYFGLAAQINSQLNAELDQQDPVPYIAIGKTYSQQGEFFAAALNMARAVAINPSDPDLYGRLGIVYYKARNYESAIPVLECAVEGCTQARSTEILCDLGYAVCEPGSGESEVNGQQVDGLLLSNSTLEYYYTYASALAFYSGTDQAPNGCAQAEVLHQQLLGQFTGDLIVMGIVDENREICSSVGPVGIEPTPESP
jgi:tetratricopeptide (TPR) repeat protein